MASLRLTLGVLLVTVAARAQVGETGRITTRSDVKMEIEGVPGTSGKKLDAFAQTLGAPLAAAKRCYGELVKEHPEVVGTLHVELELPKEGKLLVRAPDATKELAPMKKCVDEAFGKLAVDPVPRPAGVRLTLALTNSAASSVGEVRKQEANAGIIEIQEDAAGVHSHGSSTEGEVTFDVTAKDRATLEPLHKALRDSLPGLFDCRRRASKLGSPEGDLTFTQDAKGALSAGASTVKNERAPVCVGNVLKRAAQRPKAAATLVIHFKD
jgi:hypothetical protein